MKYSWLIGLLLAFPAHEGFAEETQTARIVTYKHNVAKCLAPVAIKMIDGSLRQLPESGFKLEPGVHRLAGNATASTSHCPKTKRHSRKKLMGFPTVEWLFEAGKVYYVALNHNSQNVEEWQLVVWKVETDDGELIFDITNWPPPQIPQDYWLATISEAPPAKKSSCGEIYGRSVE